MYFNLGYHGVEYEKCEKKLDFFKRGPGTCVGKLECFKCYFSVIFEWIVMKHAICFRYIPSL